jgi:hypothetical protein
MRTNGRDIYRAGKCGRFVVLLASAVTFVFIGITPPAAEGEIVALDPVTAYVVPDEAVVHGDHPWVRMEVACDHVLGYEPCEGSLVLLGWTSRPGGARFRSGGSAPTRCRQMPLV